MMKFAGAALAVLACTTTALAAVQPTSAPVEERQLNPAMIFFDWGSAKLSSDATATLDAVIAAARLQPAGSIQLRAFSDRSGSRWSSFVTSVARARAARDYLVDHGLSASTIRVRSCGELRPLVRTADGVREVQNRRVEIVLSGG